MSLNQDVLHTLYADRPSDHDNTKSLTKSTDSMFCGDLLRFNFYDLESIISSLPRLYSSLDIAQITKHGGIMNQVIYNSLSYITVYMLSLLTFLVSNVVNKSHRQRNSFIFNIYSATLSRLAAVM